MPGRRTPVGSANFLCEIHQRPLLADEAGFDSRLGVFRFGKHVACPSAAIGTWIARVSFVVAADPCGPRCAHGGCAPSPVPSRWKYAVAPAASGFLDSRAPGRTYDGSLFV